MDDHQQRERPPTGLPGPIIDHPGVTKPAGGVARALSFVKGLSRQAVVLALVVFGLQAVMGEGHRPSDLIGGFHGNIDSAEYKAKQKAAAEYERSLADAKAQAATNWQMEAEVFRQQQEATAKSLETLETAAQLADAACLGSGLVTAFFGNTPDARNWSAAMQAGCAEAARIRAQITRIQVEAARQGSAIMRRSTPGASR